MACESRDSSTPFSNPSLKPSICPAQHDSLFLRRRNSRIIINANGAIDSQYPNSVHILHLCDNAYAPHDSIGETDHLFILTKMTSKVTQDRRDDEEDIFRMVLVIIGRRTDLFP